MTRRLTPLCIAAATTLFFKNTQAQQTFPYTNDNILFDNALDYDDSTIFQTVFFNDLVPIAGNKRFISARVYPTGKISFLGTTEPEKNHIDFHGLDWSKDTDSLLGSIIPSSMFVRFDKFDAQSSDNSAYEDQTDFDIYEAYLWTFEYNFDGSFTLYQIVLAHDREGLNVAVLRNFVSNNLSSDINAVTGWSAHIGGIQVCSETADGQIEGVSGNIYSTDISEGLECVDNNAEIGRCGLSDLTISDATGTVTRLFETSLNSNSELGGVVAIQKCDGLNEILLPISQNNDTASFDKINAPESEKITCEYDPDYYRYDWNKWEYKCDIPADEPREFYSCPAGTYNCQYGDCFTDGIEVECRCHEGFTATENVRACSVNLDECATGNHNCNHGTCLDMNPILTSFSYTCHCLPEYEHDPDFKINNPDSLILKGTCDIRINDCLDQNDQNPCQTGGDANSLCTDGVRDFPGKKAFECTCSTGYTFNGDTCAPRNPCTLNPCLNNGRCNWEGGEEFECVCPKTFEGTLCEREVSVCARSQPCINGACSDDIHQGYRCACEEGWKGKSCALKVLTISINNLILSAKEPCQGGSSPTPADESIFKDRYLPLLESFWYPKGASKVEYISTYCSVNQKGGRHGRFVIQIGFGV